MSAAPATGLVGHCIVRSRSRDRAAQFGELGAGVLDRAPVDRGSYLVIRRIAVGAASIRDRDDALADVVAEAARSAARPHRGHIPSDATAVMFLDHAEMTATLLLDIARGVAGDHWWWRHLDVRVPRRVAEAVLHTITTAPAALDCLDAWGVGNVVRDVMTETELASIADAMERTHLHPSTHRTANAAAAAFRRDPGADPARGTGPINGPGARHGSTQAQRLARVRHAIATQRSFADAAPQLPTASTPARTHREPSPDTEIGAPAQHGLTQRVEAAPASVTYSGEIGRASDPGGIDPPAVVPPDAIPRRIDRSAPPMTRRDSPQRTEHGRPTATAAANTRARPGDARRSPQPATVPIPRRPEQAAPSAGIPTQLAGLFYLVGGLRAVELPTTSLWGHERWALLAAILHQLVGDTPDPIWQLLRDLSARPDPGDAFPPPDIDAVATVARSSFQEIFELADEELAELVATPGIVYATRTHIDVEIAMDRISMAARIRGLDADPGWCPELGHVIRFHFEDE